MPRKITAYACSFSCGHRVTTKKASIEAHEKTCFGNPDRKACKTCGWGSRNDWNDQCMKPSFTPPEMYEKHGVAWDCSGWVSVEDWIDIQEKKHLTLMPTRPAS